MMGILGRRIFCMRQRDFRKWMADDEGRVAMEIETPAILFFGTYLLAWSTPEKKGTKAEAEAKKRARRRKDRMVDDVFRRWK